MKITYTVHSVSREDEEAEVTIGTTKVAAKVPVLVVELVSDDPGQKNHIIRVPADELEAGEKIFETGARVIGTFSAAPATTKSGA